MQSNNNVSSARFVRRAIFEGSVAIIEALLAKPASLQDRLQRIGFDGDIPEDFVSSISIDLLSDPVTLPSSGITYDRIEAMEWIKDAESANCPNTGLLIYKIDLKNNTDVIIKRQIEMFIKGLEDIVIVQTKERKNQKERKVEKTIEQHALELKDLFMVYSNSYNHSAETSKLPAGAENLASEKLARIFFEGLIPGDYICPISHTIMNDPIVLATGIACDRIELKKLFLINNNPAIITLAALGGKINQKELTNKTAVILKGQINAFVIQQENNYVIAAERIGKAHALKQSTSISISGNLGQSISLASAPELDNDFQEQSNSNFEPFQSAPALTTTMKSTLDQYLVREIIRLANVAGINAVVEAVQHGLDITDNSYDSVKVRRAQDLLSTSPLEKVLVNPRIISRAFSHSDGFIDVIISFYASNYIREFLINFINNSSLIFTFGIDNVIPESKEESVQLSVLASGSRVNLIQSVAVNNYEQFEAVYHSYEYQKSVVKKLYDFFRKSFDIYNPDYYVNCVAEERLTFEKLENNKENLSMHLSNPLILYNVLKKIIRDEIEFLAEGVLDAISKKKFGETNLTLIYFRHEYYDILCKALMYVRKNVPNIKNVEDTNFKKLKNFYDSIQSVMRVWTRCNIDLDIQVYEVLIPRQYYNLTIQSSEKLEGFNYSYYSLRQDFPRAWIRSKIASEISAEISNPNYVVSSDSICVYMYDAKSPWNVFGEGSNFHLGNIENNPLGQNIFSLSVISNFGNTYGTINTLFYDTFAGWKVNYGLEWSNEDRNEVRRKVANMQSVRNSLTNNSSSPQSAPYPSTQQFFNRQNQRYLPNDRVVSNNNPNITSRRS